MKVNFEKIRFKNIFSYGNKITEFNFENGIDLVTGKNGRGKSTFVDALTFGLFGKPFRKIKIGNLINNKNNKDLWVEVIFNVNNSRFKIIRGQKPTIFEIYKYVNDWELIDQHSTVRDYQQYLEENILHFSDTVFRQLIALGANLDSSKGFMDLNKKEKEEVLQVITDTAIFSKIQEKLNERKNSIKTKIIDKEYQEQLLSSSLSSIRISIGAMEKQNKEYEINKEQNVLELETELSNLEEKLPKYEKGIELIKDLTEERDRLLIDLKPYKDELTNIFNEKQDIISKVKLHLLNEKNKVVCDKCGNEMKNELDFDINSLKEKKNDIEVIENEMISKRDIIQEKINGLEEKISKEPILKNKIASLEEDIEKNLNKLKKVKEWKQTEIDYSELEKTEKEYKETGETLVNLRKTQGDLNSLSNLVGDKNIKGTILNQQLPFLNKFINEFLELFESKFNFVIDSNFEDNIVSRSVNNEFNSLSNGQKQRITMSILFAFLRLIEERNGVSTNLLILDEYLDSSLDVDGINEVLKILSEVFSKNKDVILISHNPDIKNRFEIINRNVEIIQQDGFSEMNLKGD